MKGLLRILYQFSVENFQSKKGIMPFGIMKEKSQQKRREEILAFSVSALSRNL